MASNRGTWSSSSVQRSGGGDPVEKLAARVFRFDVTVCSACGGQMKIIAALTDAHSIRTYLEGVGLPARAPPVAPARPDLQHEFDYAASTKST